MVALMGHSGCPFCVEVIKMYPREYKAIFPHFMIHKPFDDNLILPFSYKPKRHQCPMLIHLPLEARRKCLGQLKQHCWMCLEVKEECICDKFWSKNPSTGEDWRRCPHCKKSIFICDHPEAEQKVNLKRRHYDTLYQEVKKFSTIPKDVVVPKLAEKTQSVYALQAMADTENKPFHTQISDIIPENVRRI